jgi:hypothetical protein
MKQRERETSPVTEYWPGSLGARYYQALVREKELRAEE